jgi:hypothetical protein
MPNDPCPPGKTCPWCGHAANPKCAPVPIASGDHADGAYAENQTYGSASFAYTGASAGYGDETDVQTLGYDGTDAQTASYSDDADAQTVGYGGDTQEIQT